MESVSNGVPILRQPKVRSARRTKTLNAILFERFASDVDGTNQPLHSLLVTVPLLAEAILLVQAAQTGFVDGPRILGALATDRLAPRRLARFNGRLAPAPGILVIAATALLTILLTGGALEPLVIAFVVAVFITFSISQWAMLRHACQRRRAQKPWRIDAAIHATSLVLCLVILAGTIVTRWKSSVVALVLIAAATAFALHIRHRYRALRKAVEDLADQPAAAVAAPTAPRPVSREAPLAIVVLFRARSEMPRVALKWMDGMPLQFSEIVLAAVSPLDAEAVEGQERMRNLEAERREQLESAAAEARARGVRVTIALRPGADVIEAAAELVLEIVRARGGHVMVVGFRASAAASPVDALLTEGDAVRLQTRLARENVPMMVVSIPLDA